MPAMGAFALAFAVTWVVKTPLYFAATGRRLLVAAVPAALTHPVTWFLLPKVWPAGHPQSLLACSVLFAVAIEAAWLSSSGVRRPIHWAALANAASVGAFALLQRA